MKNKSHNNSHDHNKSSFLDSCDETMSKLMDNNQINVQEKNRTQQNRTKHNQKTLQNK